MVRRGASENESIVVLALGDGERRPLKPVVPKPQRCAIYTRKSTEHNLDLEFNSLDAQREACEAYIYRTGLRTGD
jgi:hypothetical protein